MKIVVTDGYTLNPGDISWHAVQALGDLTVYDRTPAELIVERCTGAGIVLSNKVPFSRRTLEQLPGLKMITVLATGYNVIDTKAAAEQGIVVCNAPAYGTASVAQHTFALLLELVNHTGMHAASVAAGEWQSAADWCYGKLPIAELAGKTMGIVGYGNIGRRVAAIAEAFGMKLLFNSRTKRADTSAVYCDLETLFEKSDVVSLHCPLTEANTGFVNTAMLQRMKPSALLINTARGQLINEPDLADALNSKVIAGAGLDVLSKEPPLPANPLLTAANCIITPHQAWMTKEARARVMGITADNIKAFLAERPVNRVN
ncbi:MAG: D-2-hydroxyacid dehydrogenase [Chitinophagaceae bacterium]